MAQGKTTLWIKIYTKMSPSTIKINSKLKKKVNPIIPSQPEDSKKGKHHKKITPKSTRSLTQRKTTKSSNSS